MEDRLVRAREALHALNNAVAALRIQAAVARGAAARGGRETADLERLEAHAEEVAEASRRLGATLAEPAPARGAEPLAREAPARGAEPLAPAAPAFVAVVDDDAVLRALVTRVLAGAGHDVVAFEDAESADAWLSAGHAADVLLCDVELPGRDGRWLIARAREQRPQLPVVVLTGRAGLDVPGATVLAKPVAPEQLLATVAGLVGGAGTAAGQR